VSLAESCRRRGGQLADRIEGEGVAFLSRVADGFEGSAGGWDWARIDADQPVAAVTADCCRAMVRHFGGRA
jgi:dTMP kinase